LGRSRRSVRFHDRAGKIVAIDLAADIARLQELELTMLDD
jgi:hypothetical protein